VSRAKSVGEDALLIVHRFELSGDPLSLPWCIGHVVACVPPGQVQTPTASPPAAESTTGAIMPASWKTSMRASKDDSRWRIVRIDVRQE
jgi:hypothetical protein